MRILLTSDEAKKRGIRSWARFTPLGLLIYFVALPFVFVWEALNDGVPYAWRRLAEIPGDIRDLLEG